MNAIGLTDSQNESHLRMAPPPMRKHVPTLYEADERKYAGPHPWQIQPWAKLVRKAWHQRAYQRWVDQACNHIQITGQQNLPSGQQPAVFIANHSSHLDTLLVHTALPPEVRQRLYYGAAQDRWFVKGKKKLTLKPWYQSLVLGNFPIMRGGGAAALEYAHWLLQQGQHVFLFPEGTRAQGEHLGQFKHGAALLAAANGVPLVPIYLSGLNHIRPKGSRDVSPGRTGVDILPAIESTGSADVSELTAKAKTALDAANRNYLSRLRQQEDERQRIAA